ncbi:hypothetical protein SPI_07781 [Niveomyces insectorum RCEF 264]|uniref:Period circadian protein n=1 Tax=Niveomyces insectorum RCEF 264 TaxID=1081102 RepID=A0A167P102_9HYPO|nr:hypothetical protein SPI_07781 [Niveomyces insectorum RCEF 264]
MGILHPDNRKYTGAQGPPVASGATAPYGEPTAGSHFGGSRNANAGVGVGAGGVAGGPASIPITQTTATGPAPNTAGPHRHDILNKLDPSVDSNLSNTGTAGVGAGAGMAGGGAYNNTHHGAGNHHGISPAVGAGLGAGAGAGAAHHHNHHNANLGTTGGTTAGTGGGIFGGRHHRDGPVPVTNASAATGPASNTAGPHHSDIANRLDPTVDSRTGLRK